jgi:hypothetical protein
MSDVNDDDEDRSVDLSLEAYVAVHAAVSSGISLDAALAMGGIDAETWLDADAAWAERLADSIDRDDVDLLDRHDAILLDLQQARPRAIPLLEDDLGAFLDFLHGLAGLDNAPGFLEERDLRASDLAALHGRWAARLESDPRAREEALAILARERGPMPDVRRRPDLALLPASPADGPADGAVTWLRELDEHGAQDQNRNRKAGLA